jgi:mycothiol synthase
MQVRERVVGGTEIGDVTRRQHGEHARRLEGERLRPSLAADAVVAETDDGLIVAYAAAVDRGAEALVAPDHEGRGIGARVLKWAERRDLELGRRPHRQWLAASNETGRALLTSAGYEPEHSCWRIVLEFDDAPAPAPVPPDVHLRPLDPDADAMAVHALNETSFTGNSDYHPATFTAFTDEHLRAHDLDAGFSSVAELAGVPIGFLLARRWEIESVGFVDLLGVHPDHRGRGLATALLTAAFARFAAAGLREAQLGVASGNPRALRLYERRGMRPKFRFDTYVRAAG